MALSGVHVLCTSVRALNGATLTGASRWSETLGTAGTTQNSAPTNETVFEVRASADAFVAVGATPDASQTVSSTSSGARIFLPAGETRNLFVTQGDKLAWVAA